MSTFKRYRNTHLRVSPEGVVMNSNNMVIRPAGGLFGISPGYSVSLEQMIAELYPSSKVAHGNLYQSGVNHPKFSKWYIVDGVPYPSSRIASKATGIPYRTIQYRCEMNIKGCSINTLNEL